MVLNIFTVFVILVGAAFLLSRYVILRNLENAEKQVVLGYMEGIDALLEKEKRGIDSTLYDWSSWDDTYEFVQSRNQEYIDNNILSNPFSYLELNMMVFLDLSGNIVHAQAYNLESDEFVPVPQVVQTYLSGNHQDFQDADGGYIGLTAFPGIPPLVIAARPVLPSFEDKPSQGTLVFGRFFTASVIDNLNIYTDSDISAYTTDDTTAPPDVRDILSEYSADAPDIFVKNVDDRIVAGYRIMHDIHDEAVLILKLETTRNVYQQGRSGIRTLLHGLGGLSLVILIFVIVVTNKVGISKINILAKRVEEIGKTGNISERVDSFGNDEIDSLAKNINNMLTRLEELYDKEAELSRKLEGEMKKRVDFMRALVHELRTPLTPVLTTSEMLLEKVTNEPERSMIENVHRGAVRLNKRITELLDFVRGEVGGLEVKIASVNPAELIHEAVTEMKTEAIRKKKSVSLEIPDKLPVIAGDEDRLKQVLSNLIDNALKYSVRGDTIIVRVTTDSDNLIVEVQDHGQGISEDNQMKLFTRYSRVNQNGSPVGGLGIGLALCKNIIDLHHGKIWVRSRTGEGSVFGFSIPLGSLEPERRTNENTGD